MFFCTIVFILIQLFEFAVNNEENLLIFVVQVMAWCRQATSH